MSKSGSERRPSGTRVTVSAMDMLTGDEIAEANLTDWRKLGQGLHARYRVGDFGAGLRFVAAVGDHRRWQQGLCGYVSSCSGAGTVTHYQGRGPSMTVPVARPDLSGRSGLPWQSAA